VNVENKYKCPFAIFVFSLPGKHIIGTQTCTVESDTPDKKSKYSLFSLNNIILFLHLYPTKGKGFGELKPAN